MQLVPWEYQCSAGFKLRGWHSKPSGKPVVHFLHGNGFCSLTYTPMLELLNESFDLWLCDIQGHGDSEFGPRFLGWNKNAELVVEAFTTLNPNPSQPIYAVGHSLGAVLTSLIMANYPKLFTKAVLLDPVFFTPKMLAAMQGLQWIGLSGKHALAKRAAQRRDSWPNPQSAFAGLKPRGVFKVWTDQALWSYINHGMHEIQGSVTLKCRPSLESAFFSSFPKGLWRALHSIKQPIFLMYAQQTFPFVTQSAKRWAATHSNVLLKQVEGDHCFMQQHPKQTAALIIQWLSQTG